MRILLTNDDGYNAEGITLLYKHLQKYGEVVLLAPETSMSAKSVSITLGKPVKPNKIDKNIFSLNGTPADCAAFGLSTLSSEFDLLVSGCNDGWNISFDTMYSGTIGACLESIKQGVPAIAVSCQGNFDLVDKYFDKVFEFIIHNKLISTEYLLNVNFPLGDEVKDIQIGRLHFRNTKTFYLPTEEGYYAKRILKDEEITDTKCDVYQVNHGVVSIVPLAKTYFRNDQFELLEEKVK